MDRERKMSGGTRSTKIVEAIRFMLTNYRHMAISCSRTATHTTSWVARASRCPVDPWENKNRSNGGITSWQPRRKPPRKRNTKRIMLVQKFPTASREKHLLRGFSVCDLAVYERSRKSAGCPTHSRSLRMSGFRGPRRSRTLRTSSNREDAPAAPRQTQLIRSKRGADSWLKLVEFNRSAAVLAVPPASRALAFRDLPVLLPADFDRDRKSTRLNSS